MSERTVADGREARPKTLLLGFWICVAGIAGMRSAPPVNVLPLINPSFEYTARPLSVGEIIRGATGTMVA